MSKKLLSFVLMLAMVWSLMPALPVMAEDTEETNIIPQEEAVTISFDAKGGTPVPNEQNLRAGEKAVEPTAPTKPGWGTDVDPMSGFDGWYKDENYSGDRFDFDAEIFENVKLYARWNGRLDVEVYDRTSGDNLVGGTIACENVEESVTGRTQYGCPWVAEGSKVTVTATPAEGYRFVRWEKPGLDAPVTVSTNPVYEFTFTENPTRLYAVFEVKPLTITLIPTTIDGKRPVENYEFEILPGKSFEDVDGAEGYDAALDHFKTAEGYLPYDDDIYLLPDELGNYSSWDEVEDADLYFEKLNADATFYVPMAKSVTQIPITVEAPICGTETSFERDGYEVIPDTAVNMPVVKIESDKVQPYRNSAAKRFWWVTEDAENHRDIFNGRFVGGSKYGVFLQLAPALGYGFDEDNPPTIKVNGTVTEKILYDTPTDIDLIGLVTADHDWDEGVVDPEPTCTESGVKTSACKHNGEDWHGADASKTEEVPALGHDWGAWEVTKEATDTEDGEETRTCARCGETETRVIPHLEVEYRNVEGDGSVWEKGSTESLKFVFKRNIFDEKTFSHFTGIKVDGEDVDATEYDAESGSLVINLKPAYLETLAVGSHTLTAIFDDGEGSAEFTIVEKEEAVTPTDEPENTTPETPKKMAPGKVTPSQSPKTGDNAFVLLWFMLLCLSFFTVLRLAADRKENRCRR